MAHKESDELFYRIYDLEKQTWRALQHSGVGMLDFISDDCIMLFPLGMMLTPTSTPSVEDVLRSPAFVPWKDFQLSERNVTPIGKDGAVISYRARATRPPTEGEDRGTEFEALCSSVWRWNGETYKLCFHQQTLVS